MNKKKYILVVFLFSLSLTYNIFARSLYSYRIRSISKTKKSVYFKKGIFVNKLLAVNTTIKALRHSSGKRFERFVFDLTQPTLIYGSFDTRRLLIDFKKANLSSLFRAIGHSNYAKKIDFFPLRDKMVSVSLLFKKNVAIDVFSLKNPARLVIDVKKI